MEESKSLIPLDEIQSAAVQQYNDADVADLLKAGDWLPRLQCFGGSSDACKEGKVPVGIMGLVRAKDSIDQLGKEVVIVILAKRPKAFCMDDGEGNSVTIYDVKNPQFQSIKARSGIQNSGCMAGMEFLVWLPDTSEFATLYMASTSARAEAPNLIKLLGKAARIEATLLSNKRFKWHSPVASPYTGDVASLPDLEKAKAEIKKFVEAKDSVGEEVKDDSDRER